tara:strand:+ start:798 stop:1097 length:300 start_codon:yes stop_codon:yes gene_type:complete
MKKIISFALIVALFSCVSENNIAFEGEKEQKIEKNDEIWICHNPDSPIHQKICHQGKEYLCLEPGDSSKFCWKLKFEDCLEEENQIKQKICENFNNTLL